jgi:hypothetical protein
MEFYSQQGGVLFCLLPDPYRRLGVGGVGDASLFYPTNTSGSLRGSSVPSFPTVTVDITKEHSYLYSL